MILRALGLCALALPWPALAAGDAKRGAAIYERCAACHSIEQNRTGPRHCGLIGRPAGTVQGFEYSRAMKRSGRKGYPILRSTMRSKIFD